MMTIKRAINKRKKLHAKSEKLYAKSEKLHIKSKKLHDEGSTLDSTLASKTNKFFAGGKRLHNEGHKLKFESRILYHKGNKLFASGDLVVINAALKAYGPKTIVNFTGHCGKEVTIVVETN